MFGEEWMEFFKAESPFAYYCVLFIQFVVLILSYLVYFGLCLIFFLPLFIIYSGTKSIKIQLKKHKEDKKLKKDSTKQKQNEEDAYLKTLDKKIKKKKKKL